MSRICASVITAGFIFGMVVFPEITVSSAKEACGICFNVLFPSLFPFFVLSEIFIKCGGADFLGRFFAFFMKPLFRINGNGASAFILGIISGYPVGAKTAISLYENGSISKKEAENLICFCNNSGPLFIMSSLGIGMLHSREAGIFLYVIHILSAITLGIMLRVSLPNQKTAKAMTLTLHNTNNLFTSAVENAMTAVIKVFSYVIFFAIMMDIAQASNLFAIPEKILSYAGVNQNISNPLIRSVFEMTSAIKKLNASDTAFSLKLIISSFMLGWSGLSIIFQTKAVVDKIKIKFSKYVLAKFCHGVIASLYTYIGLKVFSFNSTTFFSSENFSPIESITSVSFTATYLTAIIYIILQVRSANKRQGSAQKQTKAR